MDLRGKKYLNVLVMLLTITVLTMIEPLVTFSQQQNQNENQNTQNIEDITNILNRFSGLWWVFMIGGIIAIPLGHRLAGIAPLWVTNLLTGGGFFAIFMAIIIAEALYVFPLFKGVLNLFKGDLALVDCVKDINPIKDLPQFIAYTFSGYCIDAQNEALAIIVWIIFVLILPLAILIALFWEFSEGMFRDNRVRNVVSVAGALIAYRVLMSTFFINFLSYGFGGIALLFFHWLFFRWGTRAVLRIVRVKAAHKIMQQEIKKQQQEAKNLRKNFALLVHPKLEFIKTMMKNARNESSEEVRLYRMELIRQKLSEIEKKADEMLFSEDRDKVKKIVEDLRNNTYPENQLFDGILEEFEKLLVDWKKE